MWLLQIPEDDIPYLFIYTLRSVDNSFFCAMLLVLISRSRALQIHNTVSISGLDPDSPHPQPWQSKIVTRNKVHRLYSQQLFYSARAGGLGCLVQDQISILYSLLGAKKWPHCAKLDIDAGVYSVRSVSWILWICEIYLYLCISCHSWLVSPRVYACNIGHRHLFSHKIT